MIHRVIFEKLTFAVEATKLQKNYVLVHFFKTSGGIFQGTILYNFYLLPSCQIYPTLG